MTAYLATSAAIFGLLVLAHVWRLLVEGPQVARDPFFLIATLGAGALSVWAIRLLFRTKAQMRGR